MDVLTFVSSVIGHVAWPGVALAVLYLAREHIGPLVSRIVEISLPGGAKASFDKALVQGQEQKDAVPVWPSTGSDSEFSTDVLERSYLYPEAVILDAFKKLEALLIDARSKMGVSSKWNLRSTLQRLVEQGLLNGEVLPLFNSLRQARNASVHTDKKITAGEALEYRSKLKWCG